MGCDVFRATLLPHQALLFAPHNGSRSKGSKTMRIVVGEIDAAAKSDFLSGAKALFMPIDWPEPLGLVMIEAMACGTPVIAYNHGAVPDIIEHGVTVFSVGNEAEAVAALARTHTPDRRRIRARFKERFTARRMARDNIEAYGVVVVPQEKQLCLAQ
jgi:glycosyltransferase involved in cell wall biosynthesis